MAAKTYEVPEGLGGKALDAIVRAVLEVPWGKARALVETGKVSVDGQVVTTVERRVRAGASVAIDPAAPKPRPGRLERDRIVFVDAHVVVVDKPSGVSTVPYDENETGTLDELVRDALAARDRSSRPPSLGIVHRIDKDTSGLVVFTRSWLAKQSLSSQFRAHTTHREYRAIVHGHALGKSYTSHLVEDRGDGLRGSIERMRGKRPPLTSGQRAVTHVEIVERLDTATLVTCRLETGRTHQIRIHLSEAGHPLLGERVYVRDYNAELLPAPRLMLHAAELGFVHPKTELEVRFRSPLPKDFEATLARLR